MIFKSEVMIEQRYAINGREVSEYFKVKEDKGWYQYLDETDETVMITLWKLSFPWTKARELCVGKNCIDMNAMVRNDGNFVRKIIIHASPSGQTQTRDSQFINEIEREKERLRQERNMAYDERVNAESRLATGANDDLISLRMAKSMEELKKIKNIAQFDNQSEMKK